MKVNGVYYRTVEMTDKGIVRMINQNELPFNFTFFESDNYKTTIFAIKEMIIRGAGAIGVCAGFAMAQAFIEAYEKNLDETFVVNAKKEIESSRPTAQNLFYAVEKVFNAGINGNHKDAINKAQELAEEDLQCSRAIGLNGNTLIPSKARILTHCNAGWLAFVDYGTALSPIYIAQENNKDIFVFVDETRPRGQGARLTAWELQHQGINHVVIPDNAAAYYMAKGEIDMVIVGADRIAANGDTANKIGTLEKAICAKFFNIPFYVAAPTSTFDLKCENGNKIPIEERSENEVLYQTGLDTQNQLSTILVCAPGARTKNPAFDVTPASLITAIITEKGIIKPSYEEITRIFN